jgi:hypothetical protein
MPAQDGAVGRGTAAPRAGNICYLSSLADADLSQGKLGSYAITHEISIDGPPREYRLGGAEDTPDEAEWRTEIGWPIFRGDGAA